MMRNSISKAIVAGLAALAMTAAAVLPTTTPASAGSGAFHGAAMGVRPMGGFGGFHGAAMGVRPMGGFGGFHGAPMGVRPGGFGGSARAPTGVRPGVGFGAPNGAGAGAWHGAGLGWHGGLNHGSSHEGWRWHAGYWRHGHWYNGWWGPAFVTGAYSDCWALEPIYDADGNYLGQQYVNVCGWLYGP